MADILMLGTLPPPVGGVTIHIRRLLNELKKEHVSVCFLDMRPSRKAVYINNIIKLLFSRECVVHYQMNNWKESAILANLPRIQKRRFISTIHSFPVEYQNLDMLDKIAIKIAQHGISCFVAPSETIKKRLICAGVLENKIKVLHTFLPPTQEEVNEVIPERIYNFVRGEKKIVLANAYKLYLNNKKEDVYGLDTCIELCRRMDGIKLVFICPLIDDYSYYNECMNRIKTTGIGERFLFFNEKISLVSLFKIAHVFIRPTVSDSYGISVAEALSIGIPAVASDVCERAEGTILYHQRDMDDLVCKVMFALKTDGWKEKTMIASVNYRKELYED